MFYSTRGARNNAAPALSRRRKALEGVFPWHVLLLKIALKRFQIALS